MLNGIDIAAILFVLVHLILSWRRGLAEEIGRVAGAILAFWVGLRYHQLVAEWMTAHTRMAGTSATVVAYVIVVLAIIIAGLILSLLVSKMIALVIPDGLNKLGGGVAGLIKGVLYTAMIFLVMNMWPHPYLNRIFGDESAIGSVVKKWVPLVQEQIDERGVADRVREQVETSRAKVEAVLESDTLKQEAGRIRK